MAPMDDVTAAIETMLADTAVGANVHLDVTEVR